MTTAPDTTAAPTNSNLTEVPLCDPIVRGSTTIDRVNLRKPKAGEMRGLQLQSLLAGDMNNLMALLPRITLPSLTMPEVENLDPADVAAMAGAVQGFFMSQAELAMMAKAMGAIEPEKSTS